MNSFLFRFDGSHDSIEFVRFSVVLNHIHELLETIKSLLVHLRIHERVVELKRVASTIFRAVQDLLEAGVHVVPLTTLVV